VNGPAELELVRDPDDRRRYVLAGVGAIRFPSAWSTRAEAELGGRRLSFAGRGIFRQAVEATDEVGTVVGRFDPRALRRGGTLVWHGRELFLQPASAFRERYALVDDGRELALLDARSWGKRPVRVTVPDGADIAPDLLLFAVFVARKQASDAGAATTAATA
jgi:hypothetical protein